MRDRPTVGARATQRELLAQMPKAEVHLHLDGSMRVETAVELARAQGADAPRTVEAMRRALVAPERGVSQAELLRAFDLPIELLQDADALARTATELVETKAADRVRYVEIRWAPLLHVKGGLPLDEGIAAVVEAASAAGRRLDVAVRLICTAMRTHEPEANVALAESAARFRPAGLTGWDLAGPEAEAPDPRRHRRAFDAARAGGLRITLHAGEWGGAEAVRRALALDPERIAHGPLAADDPALVAALIDRGVTLDLCPTSNVQAGIVPSIARHPLARLHRAGVGVTLSTDDATVSDISLTDEYGRCADEMGLSLPELWAIDRHALAVAFADETTIARLDASFEVWAAGRAEVRGDPRQPTGG